MSRDFNPDLLIEDEIAKWLYSQVLQYASHPLPNSDERIYLQYNAGTKQWIVITSTEYILETSELTEAVKAFNSFFEIEINESQDIRSAVGGNKIFERMREVE